MYAGSASKPPTEEAIQVFQQNTGIKIDVVFRGSGKVLSQMKLAKQGDLYFPGSSDYMEKAKKDGDVIASDGEDHRLSRPLHHRAGRQSKERPEP